MHFKRIVNSLIPIVQLAVVERHHPVYSRPADGTLLWLCQGLVALKTGTHVSTFQEHAGALAAQAHGAGAGRHCVLLHIQFLHASSLLLLELVQHAPLLPPPPALHILLPQHQQQRGAGGHSEHHGEEPPHPHAALLLLQQAFIVQPTQEVAEALLGGLELHQVVVQNQLPHPRHVLPQTQHLLHLVDALGPLPADEVANDVGEGLHRRVEVLVGGFQVQLC